MPNTAKAVDQRSGMRRWRLNRSTPFGRGCRNVICNQKYSLLLFIPLFLRDQFRMFYNLFFLIVGVSQFAPVLRVDSTWTYFVPLSLVLTVTLLKEAYADIKRYLLDREANGQRYERLDPISGRLSFVPSSELRVGDVVRLERNQRVPADCLLLRTSDPTASLFIRTDQLDGETDWKVRHAISLFQRLPQEADVFALEAEVCADAPTKDIHSFIGTVSTVTGEIQTVPLSVEHTLWMNTVVASSGSALALVLYTGKETRAMLNTQQPTTKISRIEHELSKITFALCIMAFGLALAMSFCPVNRPLWYVYCFRFVILFSYVIPVSLRINVDLSRTLYNVAIERDSQIQGTLVRSGNVCEELGRVSFLLSDKTGTLTKNDMEVKKLHLGTVAYDTDNAERDIALAIRTALYRHQQRIEHGGATTTTAGTRGRRDLEHRLFELIFTLALCHNVSPTHEADGCLTYQASSPDEVAIVRWTQIVGVTLWYRDRGLIQLKTAEGNFLNFQLLHIFPFTSESKRMAVLVKDESTGEYFFLQKGADSVMAGLVQQNDWLEEECGNMAREGLRTLVVARKKLSAMEFDLFGREFDEARCSLQDRSSRMQSVVSRHLEVNLEVAGLVGVEDRLADDVKRTLELLRQGGMKIWMLTGDKVETATCVAVSSKLAARNQPIHVITKIVGPIAAEGALCELSHKFDCCLVIDGASLQALLDYNPAQFIESAGKLSAVVCCRCSPTQKAHVATLIRLYTGRIVACVGDGGNDVSMIQAANIGIGIVGKEGKQASLASDVSITRFSHLLRLFLWHGRNSYKRTAIVTQFVIHRGVILTVMQAVFCGIFYLAPIALYKGLLTVGYSTIFTMFPVFSLVLDCDISEEVSQRYPELYRETAKGRCLSAKTFLLSMFKSVYQGGVIMLCTLVLFEYELLYVTGITFSALIVNELIMIALEVHTWHWLMFVAEAFSVVVFLLCLNLFSSQFNIYVKWPDFYWKMAVISAISFLPFVCYKILFRLIAPPSYAKLRQ